MRSEYGTHSLRRTKALIIYRATGDLRAVQILLGHSKIENTVGYLEIDVEDALALTENTEMTDRLLAIGEGPTSRRLGRPGRPAARSGMAASGDYGHS